jgi:hypothetical protein
LAQKANARQGWGTLGEADFSCSLLAAGCQISARREELAMGARWMKSNRGSFDSAQEYKLIDWSGLPEG